MTCRYDRDAETYLNDGEPCVTDDYGDPTKHCTARRTCSVHIGRDELTCPRCVGRVRTNLRRITPLAALMLPVALTSGVDSQAANLAGPAADPEAWTWRKVAARQGKAWHLSMVEDDDERHPLSVLGRWCLMIAEDYGHALPVLTVTRAADYLERMLPRIAQDPEQDFPLLAAEIRKCRQHLEVVAATASHQERGAPCPECTSEETGVGPRLLRVYAHWCDDEGCCRQHRADDSEDRWVCPRDREHTWTPEQYDHYLTERKGA